MTASQIIEASNRAEVSALLLSRGFMIYRPEADVGGVDLLLRTPEGKFLKCQLKARAHIEKSKYGNRDIWMIFPGKGNAFLREWYLIPHDKLYVILKEKHGNAAQWQHTTYGEYWHTPVSEELANQLCHYAIKSPSYGNGQKLLSDLELTSEMFNLDPQTAEGWSKLQAVGYSINGYLHFPEDSGGSIMSAMNNYWIDENEIPEDLFILRILLFFTMRQMYWDGIPEEENMKRTLMLVIKIRNFLLKKEMKINSYIQ